MGIFNQLFGLKKKTSQYATNGVDMVKVGLYYYLLPECEADFGKDYSAALLAALVNTVFSEPPSNETGRQFIKKEENLKTIKFVIEKSIRPQEKLRQIITDAVRVKCATTHALNPDLSEPDFLCLCREPIDNLKSLGLLVPGGEFPELGRFISNAATFVKTCKEGHRGRDTGQ